MELHDLLSDRDFPRRAPKPRDPAREADALRRLAHVFASQPEVVLQELCDIAVESCGADSAGISLEVPNPTPSEARFRWVAIAGSFAHFLHGTTPRFYSPCGTCLDRNQPQLYRVTKPYYDFLGIEAEPIADGLLIPWVVENARGTLWCVSHTNREAFDIEDYQLLRGLADFAAIAVRHRAQQEELVQRERTAAAAALANQLAHQINNPLQGVMNALFLAAQCEAGSRPYVLEAERSLEDLSRLVRTSLALPFSHDE